MTFALSTGSFGSWACTGITASSNAAAATDARKVIAIRYELFTRISLLLAGHSTVLRTGRHNFPVRQCHDSEKSGARAVSGAACFGGDGFAEGCLDVALVDVAGSEETG